MSITPKHQVSLEAGEEVRGMFWIAGRQDEAAPGVLRWSKREGASLWLIGSFGNRLFRPPMPPLTLHGRAARDGTPLSLPTAHLTSATFGSGMELQFVDSSLVLYDEFLDRDQWKKLVFRTAHLHEWLPITGFQEPTVEFKGGQTTRYSIHWKAPLGKRVPLADAALRFGARMDSEMSWQPDRSIRTALDIAVTAKNPATFASLHERFAIPLLNLLILASGRPDTMTYEVALRGRQRAVVLRRGIDVAPRQWRPDQELLFYAAHLPDFRKSIQDWIELHRRCSPAIEVYTYAINQQPLYSAAELLNMAGALETYHRVVHEASWVRTWCKRNPGKKKRGPSLLERIEDLQRIAGLPEASTGLTDANRKLFVATRNHFAHLSAPAHGYTAAQVRDATPDSIRRGGALMQACLLRELGLSAKAAEARFSAYYASWPIPQ